LQETSVSLLQTHHDQWGLALAYYWFGDVWRMQWQETTARAYAQSLDISRVPGDSWSMALALQGLGSVAYRRGNDVEACTYLVVTKIFIPATGSCDALPLVVS
jgi:hypothetical protein